MKQSSLVIAILIIARFCAWSQPANDDCINAILLEDLSDWCSEVGFYSTVGATTSIEASACLPATGQDIWFRFTAIATNLNIRALGDVVDIYGVTAFSKGTLQRPGLALYSGTCENLQLIDCDLDNGDHIAEIYVDDVVPNGDYYLRVSSAPENVGTFQLCLSSFNLVPQPESDCPTGVVLCDKSSFFVPNIQGNGRIPNEVNTSCLTAEDNSAWYKWVAGSSGSLGFTITPNHPGDDIDFAVFEMPNGLNDCADMIEIRCMASGANGVNPFGPFVAAPIDQWDQCTGPTGLRVTENDFSEQAGCNENTDNNFVASFNMEEGKAYALVVLNFSATGHGFSLEFSGTGEFLGPTADFVTDDIDGTICFGEPVTFFDQSSFGNLAIRAWQWNFGENAIPQTGEGAGPHQVVYTSGGEKSIALTVESETGCLVTEIGSVIVEQPFDVLADITDQSCPESQDGRIELAISSGSNVTSIIWENGQTGPVLEDVDPGEYQVTITNFNGCDTTISFAVESPMPLEIEEIITRPSCGGGADGQITLNVNGQAPPFQFDFGTGFSPSNTASGLIADIYDIVIADDNGCITEVSVPLGEINIELDPDFDPITPPTCFGFNNGQVEIRISGGNGGYAFFYNGQIIPGDQNVFDNLSAGLFDLSIRDGSNCLGFVQLDIPQPDSLVVNLDTSDISCFGANDGQITPLVAGGTGTYSFNWPDIMVSDSVADGLSQGQYQLLVTDQNGCVANAEALITEPPPLGILIDSTLDNICFGQANGAIYFDGFGGSPPFQYSIDGNNFSETLAFQGLRAGTYTISIRDNRGCINTQEAMILEPEALLVDAGRDTSVNLGFSVQLLATHQPSGKPVDYQWQPEGDCSDCQFQEVMPLISTFYVVTIVDDDGCTASDSVEVAVFANRPVYIPNAFTPDGDGRNDRVTIYTGAAGQQVRGIRTFHIFDRWGEEVFEGRNLNLNDESVGWDGTFKGQPMNPGVFVYVAEVEFIDGSMLQFEGDITLIR